MAATNIDTPTSPSCCFVPRGDWDRLTVYEPLDLITHNGSSYIALVSSIGTEPTFYSSSWMVLASKGDTAQLNPRGPWQKSVLYEPLDLVSYQGSSWIARRSSIGRAPAENSFWMLLAERSTSGGSSTIIQGGGGAAFQNVFIQPAAPTTSEPTYLWIQTGLGVSGTDMTFWIEDNIP